MKKLIVTLLALTMALTFAGCAKTEAPTEHTAAATEAPVVETTEAAAQTEAAGAAVMSHEAYMAAPIDTLVTIETYVQARQSWWNNKVTVYCQSPDGAYLLYELTCTEEDAVKLVPGTKIQVTGAKGEWAGEVEITDGVFSFLEGGDTFIAEAADMTGLLGTDRLIAHQNEKVVFRGMTVEEISYKNDEPGDDIYVTLGYNGASYAFCVEVYLTDAESDVYTTVGTLKEGDVVDVEGFLYWHEGMNPRITGITVVK